MLSKLFFFHNPKAGGMSVLDAIKTSMTGSTVCPMIENDIADHRRLRGYYSSFRGYDLYAGHYGRDVFDCVNDGHAYCSNFRHPVSRVLSLYNFFRTYPVSPQLFGPRHYIPLEAAKTSSFADFVSHPSDEVQSYVSNAHFRQLTSSAYELGIRGSLIEALRFIDGMLFIFVTEYPDESLSTIRKTTPIQKIEHINATTGHDKISLRDLSAATRDDILSRNQLDLALYDHAVALIKKRHHALYNSEISSDFCPATDR